MAPAGVAVHAGRVGDGDGEPEGAPVCVADGVVVAAEVAGDLGHVVAGGAGDGVPDGVVELVAGRQHGSGGQVPAVGAEVVAVALVQQQDRVGGLDDDSHVDDAGAVGAGGGEQIGEQRSGDRDAGHGRLRFVGVGGQAGVGRRPGDGRGRAVTGSGGRGGQPTDAGGVLDVAAQPGDLVVLGGKTRQGLGLELGELGDRRVLAGQAFLQRGDLGFQPVDLGFPQVGGAAGLADGGEPGLEFLAQAGVGTGAVEGGAVDAGFAGEGLDIAFAAGRDVAAAGGGP